MKKRLVFIFIMLFLLGLTSAWAVNLTERERELLDTLKLAREYISSSYSLESVYPVYKTLATRLREQADRIEQQDKDILYIDEIIRKYEEEK